MLISCYLDNTVLRTPAFGRPFSVFRRESLPRPDVEDSCLAPAILAVRLSSAFSRCVFWGGRAGRARFVKIGRAGGDRPAVFPDTPLKKSSICPKIRHFSTKLLVKMTDLLHSARFYFVREIKNAHFTGRKIPFIITLAPPLPCKTVEQFESGGCVYGKRSQSSGNPEETRS